VDSNVVLADVERLAYPEEAEQRFYETMGSETRSPNEKSNKLTHDGDVTDVTRIVLPSHCCTLQLSYPALQPILVKWLKI
jgi:hypothetical protein